MTESRSYNKKLDEELTNVKEVIKKQNEILSAFPESPEKIIKTWEEIKAKEDKSIKLEEDIINIKKEVNLKEDNIKELNSKIDILKTEIEEKELLLDKLPKKSKNVRKEMEQLMHTVKDKEVEINNLNRRFTNTFPDPTKRNRAKIGKC